MSEHEVTGGSSGASGASGPFGPTEPAEPAESTERGPAVDAEADGYEADRAAYAAHLGRAADPGATPNRVLDVTMNDLAKAVILAERVDVVRSLPKFPKGGSPGEIAAYVGLIWPSDPVPGHPGGAGAKHAFHASLQASRHLPGDPPAPPSRDPDPSGGGGGGGGAPQDPDGSGASCTPVPPAPAASGVAVAVAHPAPAAFDAARGHVPSGMLGAAPAAPPPDAAAKAECGTCGGPLGEGDLCGACDSPPPAVPAAPAAAETKGELPFPPETKAECGTCGGPLGEGDCCARCAGAGVPAAVVAVAEAEEASAEKMAEAMEAAEVHDALAKAHAEQVVHGIATAATTTTETPAT